MSRLLQGLLLGAAAVVALNANSASATALIDTYTTSSVTDQAVLSVGQNYQKLSEKLTFSAAATITDIQAAISPYTGNVLRSVQLGLMADASNQPSGTFLDVATVYDPSFTPGGAPLGWPVNLTGLSWSVTAGTSYWLTAISGGGSFGVWTEGTDAGTFAYNSDGNWNLNSGGALEVLINGTLTSSDTGGPSNVPEPASLLTLAVGVVGLRFSRKRRA